MKYIDKSIWSRAELLDFFSTVPLFMKLVLM